MRASEEALKDASFAGFARNSEILFGPRGSSMVTRRLLAINSRLVVSGVTAERLKNRGLNGWRY